MSKPERFSILLGVTGSIAAYKAAELIRQLRALRDPSAPERRIDVRVILTRHGAQFITTVTLQTLSGNAVYQELFQSAAQWDVQHVGLADNADLLLIAPASANILAKMANGLADDLLSTTVLACQAPALVAPAMNVHMWEHPATQANVRTLLARGVTMIGPAEGELACGYTGRGKMSPVEDIVETVGRHFLQDIPEPNACTLQGRTVLITAGPTREHLDPVRFLSNPSSGKMGYALAAVARVRGARVILVSGPVTLPAPEGVEFISVTSCAEMAQQVLASSSVADIIIGAAAPADFTPAHRSAQKVKKTGNEELLTLCPTTDILLEVGQRKEPGQIIVAFAAETEELEKSAREKMTRKHADMIVANDVSGSDAGFAVDTNRGLLLYADGRREELPLQRKEAMAAHILDAAAALLPAR